MVGGDAPPSGACLGCAEFRRDASILLRRVGAHKIRLTQTNCAAAIIVTCDLSAHAPTQQR